WVQDQAAEIDRRALFSSARRFCDQVLILNARGGDHSLVGTGRIPARGGPIFFPEEPVALGGGCGGLVAAVFFSRFCGRLGLQLRAGTARYRQGSSRRWATNDNEKVRG